MNAFWDFQNNRRGAPRKTTTGPQDSSGKPWDAARANLSQSIACDESARGQAPANSFLNARLTPE
eukprot:8331165-Pyramimonas_sp.AAC.1